MCIEGFLTVTRRGIPEYIQDRRILEMERAVSVQREVGLSGTALKVIALVTMLLDHIHYFFGY